MTRRTNARIAGVAFLVYIAAAMPAMVLYARATAGEGVATQLAAIAHHATALRATILLGMLGNLCALVLGVTLYSITREEDPDLALLAMACRLAEGNAGMDVSGTLGLLWLATSNDATALDAGAASALGAYLLKTGKTMGASAAFFAVGSALFSWLLLRGRMIPAALGWLGVLASILVVVCFPLQLAGLLGGPIASFMWYPMLVFEVTLALWLIVKGAATRRAGP